MRTPTLTLTTTAWRPKLMRQAHHEVAFWLIFSASLLAILIPGGPVENRDFSLIHPLILGTFNVFLTTLDLGSLALLPFVLQRKRWANRVAFSAAMAYFSVYALDLASVFPRSPTPMSEPLALIEILGLCVAVPLMLASSRVQPTANVISRPPLLSRSTLALALVLLLLIGAAIVFVATDAAMSSSNTVTAAGQSIDVTSAVVAARKDQ